MSSMLDQAIVDATALKEAAIKNAEQEILEKYSQDIREAVDALLEAIWIVEVGNDDRQSLALVAVHELVGDSIEPGGAAGVDVAKKVEHLEDALLATGDRQVLVELVGERDDANPIQVREADIGERSCHLHGVVQFQRRADKHRLGRVQ